MNYDHYSLYFCYQVLPHVEPPATPPIQQRIPIGSRNDAQQTIRLGTRHPHQLVLLGVPPPLRRVPGARAALRSVEEGVGRTSH